jgi:hypothetical protein
VIEVAFGILAVGGLMVAARLGLVLGYERGYEQGVQDAATAIEKDIATNRKSSYFQHFGGQIDAGRRGEN